jgi:hypothetical protein
MSKFLTISRKLIEYSIAVHLFLLKLVITLSDRAVGKAMTATDAANVAAIMAKQAHSTRIEIETATKRAHSALLAAANAEAKKLRRGAVIA